MPLYSLSRHSNAKPDLRQAPLQDHRPEILPLRRLVLPFRKTEPGTRFAPVWKTARIIRDLGEAAEKTPTPAKP